jgi:DNA primase large subunit
MRRIYIERGYAYVPQDEIVVIVQTLFREHLSHALAVSDNCKLTFASFSIHYFLVDFTCIASHGGR